MAPRADGTVSHAFSDPSNADSDSDGLRDGDEQPTALRPGRIRRDPDTDYDGRTDGQERSVGSNPLRPDLSVTVTYANLTLVPPSSGEDDTAEWKWGFFVQAPGGDFPGQLASDQFDCPRYDSCVCVTYQQERTLPLNRSTSLDLAPGEAIVLNGLIHETHDNRGLSCPNGDPSVFASANGGDRIMSFIDQAMTYEQLSSGQFTSRSIAMVASWLNTGTAATVFAEVAVNCAGSGRGICRDGSLCVADNDCESTHCGPPDVNDRNRRRCVDFCGDGERQIPSETCDDGNQLECGSCNRDCSGAGSGVGCAGGVVCVNNADCASGTCLPIITLGQKVCTAACGNGWVEGNEACDDGNTLSCGTCNPNCTLRQAFSPACANGVECAYDDDCISKTCTAGVCVAACGIGVLETGEACDDGNAVPCGRCNATCSAVNSPVIGCPADTSCFANADCASASCVGEVCN